jgi:hypothetical protein
LVIVVALEARAHPPLGPGPLLRFDWGAVGGTVAPTLGFVGAWSVLLVRGGTVRDPA